MCESGDMDVFFVVLLVGGCGGYVSVPGSCLMCFDWGCS